MFQRLQMLERTVVVPVQLHLHAERARSVANVAERAGHSGTTAAAHHVAQLQEVVAKE